MNKLSALKWISKALSWTYSVNSISPSRFAAWFVEYSYSVDPTVSNFKKLVGRLEIFSRMLCFAPVLRRGQSIVTGWKLSTAAGT